MFVQKSDTIDKQLPVHVQSSRDFMFFKWTFLPTAVIEAIFDDIAVNWPRRNWDGLGKLFEDYIKLNKDYQLT